MRTIFTTARCRGQYSQIWLSDRHFTANSWTAVDLVARSFMTLAVTECPRLSKIPPDFHHHLGGEFTITGARQMATKPNDWQAQVKALLKAELKRRKVSYFELADKLAAIGVEDNEKNIANKISRGTFKAIFFIQCLEAIGCETVRLTESFV
jgi:hypothetical protein